MSDGTNILEPTDLAGGEVLTPIDTVDVDFGSGVHRERQRIALAGKTAASDAAVKNSQPSPTDYGLVVRSAGTIVIDSSGAMTDGSQKTQLMTGGNVVSSAHPLPVAGTFSDENGVPFSVGNPLPVSVGDLSVQQLTVAFPNSEISTANATGSPLGANAVFTGSWEDVSKFAAISAIVLTDQNSALNGALVQFSADGMTATRTIAATIPANQGLSFIFGAEARYFRIVYTNGPVAQTVFQTQIILHYQTPVAPQLPLGATTSDASLAQSAQAHMKARQTNGIYIPVRADNTGALATNDASTQALLNSIINKEMPYADFDPNNTHSAPFAANETFTGQWTEFGPIPGMDTLFIADSQPVSVSIEWSADGINKDTSILGTTPIQILPGSSISGTWSGTFISNIPVNKYYRIKVVNGSTAGTSFGHVRMWRLRAPFGGSFGPLASIPTNFSVALLTRAIQSGVTPDGSFVNLPLGGHDSDNSTQTLLGANGTYVGLYKQSAGISSMLVFALSDQPLTTARIEWSHDGTNPAPGIISTSDMVGTVQVFDNPAAGPGAKVYVYLTVITTIIDKFYRLKLVNGATPQGLFGQADFWTYDKPFTGSFSSLTSTLNSLSTALLTRAVNAGTLPDGTFKNEVIGGVDPKQSPQLQTVPVLLGVGQTFTGPWANVEGFSDVAAMVLSDVNGTAFFDYSMDGITQHRTFAYPITGGTNSDWIAAAPRGKFFRFRYLNDGTAQTVFQAQITYSTTPYGDQFGRLATAPTDDTVVATTKSVNTGRKPDGIYVNQPETGVSALNNTTTPLAANATWTGGWENCDQYSDVAVNLRADVAGGTSLTIDFSQDGISVDRTANFIYNQFPLGSTFAVPVQARFCRVSYNNGGAPQTLFRLQTRLVEESLDGATAPINEGITDSTMAQIQRSVISGKAPDGTYHNVIVSNTGAVRADIEALPTVLFGSYTVGTSVSQVVVSGFANRRTVSLKADPGNSGIVYVSNLNSVTSSNGYPLNAGDAIEIDAATGINFYAVGSKANQRLATLEIGSP